MERFVILGAACLFTAACSLSGEPRFYRPLPDAAAIDGAIDDGSDAAAPDGGSDVVMADAADAADAADVSVDVPPTCTANELAELCNGLDDNCNGVVDDVTPAGGPPIPCVSGTQPGHIEGCRCVADRAAVELCWNGLDDDGNGAVDDRCGCDAFVVANAIDVGIPTRLFDLLGVSRPVLQSVAAAISATAAAPTRTVCIVSSLTSGCAIVAQHNESFTVPANTTVVGGFTVSGTGVLASTAESCRSRVAGKLAFASDSNERSMLARVNLTRSASGEAIRIDNSGWIIDSTVRNDGASGSESLAIFGSGNGVRVLANVSATADGVGDVSAVRFVGGTVFGRDLRVHAVNGQRAYGVHLQGVRLAALSRLTVESLLATESMVGLTVENPAGYTLISGFGGGAAGGTHAAGVRISGTSGSGQVVRIENANWLGAAATDEALGMHVRDIRAELIATTTSTIIGRSTAVNTGTRADALRCEADARCVVAGSAPARVALLATAAVGEGAMPVASIARAVAVLDGASALISNSNLRGGNASRSSRALEFDGRALRVVHSELSAGTAASDSISAELSGGVSAELIGSVLRGDHGIALQLDAQHVRASQIVSNTLTRTVVSRASPLLFVQSIASAPGVHFENNLLSCATSATEPVQYGMAMTDNASPFSVFAYNMVASCSVLLTVGSVEMTMPTDVQMLLARGAMTGGLRSVASAGLSANGWLLTASSPAQSVGSPIVRGTLDFEGMPRPAGAGPDIGADER